MKLGCIQAGQVGCKVSLRDNKVALELKKPEALGLVGYTQRSL